MYIFELIAKKLKEKKEQKNNTFQIESQDSDLPEKCEHTFFPIDSTGKMLACSKCGMMIENNSSKIKPRNPFN